MMWLKGEIQMKAAAEACSALYPRFVELAVDADVAPLRLAADAFPCGLHWPTARSDDQRGRE